MRSDNAVGGLSLKLGLALALAAVGGCNSDQSPPDVAQAPARGAKQRSGEKVVVDPAVTPATAREPVPDRGLQGKKRRLIIRKSVPKASPVEESSSEAPAPPEDGWLEDESFAMPVVVLSTQHAETCHVMVGDTMPNFVLADLNGQKQPLAKHFGAKLTVVCFWNARNRYAVEELADLGPKVVGPYGPAGVNVVAVDVYDSPQAVKQIIDEANVDFPVLLDPKGDALKQIATKMMPRTYLLDASGKILWFDIEYSRTTRHDLRQAIRSALSSS